MSIVWLDCETTGLDERVEDVFEVAVIRDDGEETVFRIEPRPEVVRAMHPKAVEVNRYHERTSDPAWRWHDPYKALHALWGELDGVHICGAVPDFDARHLAALYRRFGMEPPRHHYHLIDIEAKAVGYLDGRAALAAELARGHGVILPVQATIDDLPWDSDELSRACGVEPPGEDERHTALGDARWVRRLYLAITGGVA